ncbi:MAG TPA: hypothetical protein VNW71_11535 [Thermoanaerobaculia bacterium]|nr:hypothetical protein [Thermoanaerobaculia bacterium]
MSRKSVRRAALGLIVAVLLGIAMPVPASAWLGGEIGGETRGETGTISAGFFSVVWEWLQDLWPERPDPVQPACTENCGEAGHGVDPNG